MATQTTLLTSHKGVDLHAATAVRVMQRRLADGDALRALRRCELHTFWDEGDGRSVAELLEIGRYFNPNKHHYGHFALEAAASSWPDTETTGGAALPDGWPGAAVAGDLADTGESQYDALLGGPAPAGCVAVDLVTLPLGETGAVRSGVLWRLVLAAEGRAPERLAERLAVVRRGDQGLLVNPHLHGWLMRVRRV